MCTDRANFRINNLMFLNVVVVLVLLLLSGCAPVERSASMALDNANSVMKTGQEKLWVEPDARTVEERDREREQERGSMAPPAAGERY